MQIKFQKVLKEAVIPHYAHQGDAGMDIFSAEETEIEEARELSETKRGEGGFGSTGLFKKE